MIERLMRKFGYVKRVTYEDVLLLAAAKRRIEAYREQMTLLDDESRKREGTG